MKKPKLFSNLDRLGHSFFTEAVQKPRIVTCLQGVVTYTIPLENPDAGAILQHVLDPQEIDRKIREILAITPDISLEKLVRFGQAMGISISDFEKARPSVPPDQDVIF